MSADYQPRRALPEPAGDPAPPKVATQLRHPWRATVRTVVWYVLTVLATIPAAAPILRDQLGPYVSRRVIEALMWLAGLAGAVLATVQRVALTPPAAKLIARLGLGTGHDDTAKPA